MSLQRCQCLRNLCSRVDHVAQPFTVSSSFVHNITSPGTRQMQQSRVRKTGEEKMDTKAPFQLSSLKLLCNRFQGKDEGKHDACCVEHGYLINQLILYSRSIVRHGCLNQYVLVFMSYLTLLKRDMYTRKRHIDQTTQKVAIQPASFALLQAPYELLIVYLLLTMYIFKSQMSNNLLFFPGSSNTG